jgi:hypothetical protein
MIKLKSIQSTIEFFIGFATAGDSTRVWVETEVYGVKVESRTSPAGCMDGH